MAVAVAAAVAGVVGGSWSASLNRTERVDEGCSLVALLPLLQLLLLLSWWAEAAVGAVAVPGLADTSGVCVPLPPPLTVPLRSRPLTLTAPGPASSVLSPPLPLRDLVMVAPPPNCAVVGVNRTKLC